MESNAAVTLKMSGEYACFTRPEFKVERVSYLVITPSAARGALEAIFWKPEFRYEIRQIGIVKMGSQTSILRNELDARQGKTPILVERHRQQRSSLVLKDVEYIIRAEMVLRAHATDPIYKYRDQFNRRLNRGQCHHTPYLGTREFAAQIGPPNGDTPSGDLNLDLGTVLFDLAYIEDPARDELEFIRHDGNGGRVVKGYVHPLFFSARIENGWLRVPPEKYEQLRRLEARDA